MNRWQPTRKENKALSGIKKEEEKRALAQFVCSQGHNFLPVSFMSVLSTNHCAPSSVNPT
jgi:hypothetical protein